MGNNRRRQRVKRARISKEVTNEARRAAVRRADAEERAREGVGWCPIPDPKSFGGCLARAAWEALPPWEKMLDYRLRLAWAVEAGARRRSQVPSDADGPPDGARVV